jgi:predicted nucleotide-binding protein (sugar kinase/HSP70/actin superfamily)
VGYQTRIEAGLDAFINDFERKQKSGTSLLPNVPRGTEYETGICRDDAVYFPYLSPILDDLLYAAFAAHGYNAKGLPLDRKIINLGYKYVSGGECMPNVAIAGSVINAFKQRKLDPKKSVLYLGDSCISCNFHQYTSLIKAACRKAGIDGLRIYSPKMGLANNTLPKQLSMDMAATSVMGSLLYKLYFRCHPYEKVRGATQLALDQSIDVIKKHLIKKPPLWEIPIHLLVAKGMKLHAEYIFKEDAGRGSAVKGRVMEESRGGAVVERLMEFLHPSKYMLAAAREIRGIFDGVELEGKRKPRIGLLGDLYVKYNTIINEDIYQLIEELGGEILVPSYMETGAHLMDASVRESGASRLPLLNLVRYEKSFESVFKGLLDDCFEPSVEECVELLHQNGFKHFIPGETTINVSRLLYYAKHKLVDAVIHVNPILCCPGTVTASLYRKLQKKLHIPVVDVYYDGINKPNKIIIPQMSKPIQDFALRQSLRRSEQ